MTKDAIVTALLASLTAQLRRAQAAAAAAFAAATDDEAKAENKYDTRALEQSYVSAGQGARIAALSDTLSRVYNYKPPTEALTRCGPGALVHVELDRGDSVDALWLFILPFAVGESLEVDGTRVMAVDARAALPVALRGLGEGESARVGGPQGRLASVLQVA